MQKFLPHSTPPILITIIFFVFCSFFQFSLADIYVPFSCEDDAADILNSIRRNVSDNYFNRLPKIIGYEDVVEDVHGLIVNPIKYPEEYTGLLEINRGLMLFGPPGIGKTLMIAHLEKELNTLGWEVWYIKPTDIYKTAYVGEAEQRLQCIFRLVNNRQLAKNPKKKGNSLSDLLFGGSKMKSIVKSISIDSNGNIKEYNDEMFNNDNRFGEGDEIQNSIQSLLKNMGINNKFESTIEIDENGNLRNLGNMENMGDIDNEINHNNEEQKIEINQNEKFSKVLLVFDEGETIFTRDKKHNSGVVAELLHELNDIKHSNFSIVVMTNRPTIIDPALRRRLGHQFCIRLPTATERRSMFKTLLLDDHWSLSKDIDYKSFDEKTRLFSGDDILRLTQQILRKKVSNLKPPFRKNATPISNQELKEALDFIKSTSSDSELVEYAEYSKLHSKLCYEEFLPDPVVHLKNATIHDEEPDLW